MTDTAIPQTIDETSEPHDTDLSDEALDRAPGKGGLCMCASGLGICGFYSLR